METTTIEDLKKLDKKTLLSKRDELKKELFKVKFEVKNGQAKNSDQIGKLKKEIARINTLLKQIPVNK